MLLDAGADPNTGFFEQDHEPELTFESVLYGAAGVAHHAGLTRLLLARGADPNLGGEVAYHAPEGFDSEAMHAVVKSGRLSREGLTTMLHRKLDWTDLGGVRWLLSHGADPNAVSGWGDRALHHSLARDNVAPLIEALLDFGADPLLSAPWPSAPSPRCRSGRPTTPATSSTPSGARSRDAAEFPYNSCKFSQSVGPGDGTGGADLVLPGLRAYCFLDCPHERASGNTE